MPNKSTRPTKPKGQLTKGGGKGLSGDALVGKVSQKTIDDIKRLGMTEALKLAGKNGATSGGAAREFQEGVRRMYGARRLAEAKAKYSPAPSTAGKGRSSTTVVSSKPATKKTTAKKNNNLGLKIAGGAAAAGLLIASRGKAVGAASKLAPALAKSGIAKKLLGTGETFIKNPVVTKATAGIKAGSKQPKVPGTRMEYAAKMAQDKARQELAALAKKKAAASAAATKKVGKK